MLLPAQIQSCAHKSSGRFSKQEPGFAGENFVLDPLALHDHLAMEPVTIVSLISACMGVTKGAIDAIQGLDRARQIYGDAKATMKAIEAKLGTLDFALMMLKAWSEQLAARPLFPGFLDQLSVQIRGCLKVISAVRTKVETKDDLGKKEKGRFVWNQSRIRDLERDLDSQVQALQMLLVVSQL